MFRFLSGATDDLNVTPKWKRQMSASRRERPAQRPEVGNAFIVSLSVSTTHLRDFIDKVKIKTLKKIIH